MEGISDLPELIKAVIRSSLEDEVLVGALKQRVEDMQARLSRLKDRFDRKRELACWAMTSADIGKIQTEDFTLSLRQGPPRLEVTDQEKIPEEFFLPQPPRLDRVGLIQVLKRGDVIPGSHPDQRRDAHHGARAMSDFSKAQLRRLKGKLDRRHVQSREVEGRSVDYIEGWFAIAQANAIFGFAGWDREMTHFERIYERSRGDVTSCAYVARVRIRVRTGRSTIVREGTGCGSATANTSGEAHDLALKAAETDATKRALATFGNCFGLGLYDKEQNGVTAKKAPPNSFILYDPMGAPFAQNLSAEAFCSGLRQLIQASSVPAGA